MARFKTSARLLGLAVVALQGALAAKAADITHQSPENAAPIPYLKPTTATSPRTPTFNVQCEGELQKVSDPANGLRKAIVNMCARHKGNLRDGANLGGLNGDMAWNEAENSDTDPFTWGFNFITNPSDAQKTCPFDCETIFGAFADISDCIKSNGVLKNGEINTECGRALYGGYTHTS